MMAEVDGCYLAVDAQGEGAHPVVLVHGSGQPAWKPLLAALPPPSIRTIVYDRPGLGRSAPLPPEQRNTPRTYTWAADRLRSLLEIVGVRAPRVLVGHSLGGTIIEAYARRWPDDVAGLVFLDAADTALRCEFKGQPRISRDGGEPGAIAFDRRAALAFLEASGPLPKVPAMVVTAAVGRWLNVDEPDHFLPFSLAELDDKWQQCQRDLARRSQAPHILARTAGHRLELEAPDLVALAVEAVVTAVRDSTNPIAPPECLAATGGDLVGPS